MSFENIYITGIDETASREIEKNFFDISLILSAAAPAEWIRIFNAKWKSHFYMQKRNVQVLGSKMHIQCVPDEIKSHHKRELDAVISASNIEFIEFLAKENEQRMAKEALAQQNKDRIKALSDDIFSK